MCVHELHTAVDEDIPVTTIVFNNNDYAIISEAAERSYQLPEGSYRWDHSPVSFIDLAGSVGMDGIRAETPTEIEKALSEAATLDEPTLIEIPIDPREPQVGPWMSDDPVH
jgi:acetolactate synthase-1/2/3 large subunit